MESHATFNELNRWSKKLFEKFGYMILAHSRGDTDKVREYVRCLKHLCVELEIKKNKTLCVDKKADLDIMCGKAKILYRHALIDFKMNDIEPAHMIGGKKRKSSKKSSKNSSRK
jgi:hypothetical protein